MQVNNTCCMKGVHMLQRVRLIAVGFVALALALTGTTSVAASSGDDHVQSTGGRAAVAKPVAQIHYRPPSVIMHNQYQTFKITMPNGAPVPDGQVIRAYQTIRNTTYRSNGTTKNGQVTIRYNGFPLSESGSAAKVWVVAEATAQLGPSNTSVRDALIGYPVNVSIITDDTVLDTTSFVRIAQISRVNGNAISQKDQVAKLNVHVGGRNYTFTGTPNSRIRVVLPDSAKGQRAILSGEITPSPDYRFPGGTPAPVARDVVK